MKRSSVIRPALAAILLAAATLAPLSPIAADTPGGQAVAEGLRIRSKILGKDVAFAVYLPPDYDLSKRRYPVVYLLHGYTDDESGWIQFGEVNLAADRAIAAREIPPMIIVMPDGGVAGYSNDAEGKVRYEEMIVREFIPHVDATYRTRPDRQFRGVAGLSMGGWGTLVYVGVTRTSSSRRRRLQRRHLEGRGLHRYGAENVRPDPRSRCFGRRASPGKTA